METCNRGDQMAASAADIFIKTRHLTDVVDLVRIEDDIRAGYVVFLETADFFDKYDQDIVQLKQSLDRLNALCRMQGGQIARVGEDILVLTPNSEITLF